MYGTINSCFIRGGQFESVAELAGSGSSYLTILAGAVLSIPAPLSEPDWVPFLI
jgi:hypothetical protein